MKIAVFYHIYQWGPWEEIFNEQWKTYVSSNLLDVADITHIGLNGKIFGESGNPRIRVKFNQNQEMQEAETLKDLFFFARENPGYKILYFHAKGVSNYSKNTNDWRKMMNYFCIEKWRDCIPLLDIYDAVGCNLQDHNDNGINRPHFSGNFWWARSDYVSKLDYSFLESNNRFQREFWIGTGNGKLHELHKSNVNHYDSPYPEELYRI